MPGPTGQHTHILQQDVSYMEDIGADFSGEAELRWRRSEWP